MQCIDNQLLANFKYVNIRYFETNLYFLNIIRTLIFVYIEGNSTNFFITHFKNSCKKSNS